ncbi:MAG: AI-2E family transporter [Hungatella sp.]|nr:AI-2E family transporter [Hungatella sp.]
MKEHKLRDYIYWGVTAVLVIITCIAAALIFIRWQAVLGGIRYLNQVLAPITYGAVLAYLLSPVYNRVYRLAEMAIKPYLKTGKKRNGLAKAIATIASLVFLLTVVMGLFQLILPRVFDSIKGIINSIPGNASKIGIWIETLFADYPDIEGLVLRVYNEGVNKLLSVLQSTTDLIPNIEKVITGVYTGLYTSIMGTVNLAKNMLIGIIVMLYLLNIKDILTAQAKKVIYSLFSLPIANEMIEKWRFIHRVFGGFIIGKLLDSLIIGVLTFVWLSILEMPYTVLISVIVGVTNIIPFFGPFIGAIPSALLVLLVNPKKCLWFLLSILAIQQLDGNIIGPKILGNSTGLSSFWVLFAILFFGGILGPIGMIIGVPIFAVFYRLLAEWVNKRLKRKELSTITDDYGILDHIDEEKKTYIRVRLYEKEKDDRMAGRDSSRSDTPGHHDFNSRAKKK